MDTSGIQLGIGSGHFLLDELDAGIHVGLSAEPILVAVSLGDAAAGFSVLGAGDVLDGVGSRGDPGHVGFHAKHVLTGGYLGKSHILSKAIVEYEYIVELK